MVSFCAMPWDPLSRRFRPFCLASKRPPNGPPPFSTLFYRRPAGESGPSRSCQCPHSPCGCRDSLPGAGKSPRHLACPRDRRIAVPGHPLSFASAAKIFRFFTLAARNHLIRLERDGLAELATRRKTGTHLHRPGRIDDLRANWPLPCPQGLGSPVVTTGRPLWPTACPSERCLGRRRWPYG